MIVAGYGTARVEISALASAPSTSKTTAPPPVIHIYMLKAITDKKSISRQSSTLHNPVPSEGTAKEKQKEQRASDNFCKSTAENHIERFYPGSNRRLSD